MDTKPTFGELIGGAMVIVALLVLAYSTVVQGDGESKTAFVALVSAGVGFFLRSKVQPPTS